MNELSKKIWKDRYQKNGETVEENLYRVANHISKNENNQEKYTQEFYNVMNKGYFYPAGRIMSNAGIGNKLTLNNCFVSPMIKDDLNDIFDKVKLGAITHKAGGGIGYSFSNLRPDGSNTSNDATASGAVSFMSVFDAQTSTILQGGRRGANMGVMSIYNLEIEKFVTAKSKNTETLKHFNLSIMVDDDFMKAKENDENIFLHHPVYDEKGKVIKDSSKWQYSKEVNAKELWDLIIKEAYNTGEPGILFEDNMNKDNNTWYIEQIVATNPCFTGDMQLLTDKGYVEIGSLENKDFNIVSYDGQISKGRVWCSGEKETIKLTLSNGIMIKCTPNHIFMTEDGREMKAERLLGKRIMPPIEEGVIKEGLRVLYIQSNGEQKVYDFNEPINHWGIIEGCVVHNCGEYLAGTVSGKHPQTGKQLNSNDYGGACNLGSLFLHNFIKNSFEKRVEFDYEELAYTIKIATRMLDNIIDINYYPDKIYENYQKSFRTIGIGTTGLADCLAMMGIKYNSKEAKEFVDNLYNFIAKQIYKTSIELAKEKGSFEFLDKAKFAVSRFITKHMRDDSEWCEIADDIREHGIRNARMISIAPTGTLSLTFGNNCSSGIEPIFLKEYTRKMKLGGQDETDIQEVTVRDYAYELWKNKKENNVVKEDCFVTTNDMDVLAHIDILSALAYHVDMSVSKTINVPENYPFDKTEEIYDKCHEAGIKGCTIFRPNPIRQGILISKETAKEEEKTNEELIQKIPQEYPIYIKSPSDDAIGKKRRLTTGCGTLWLQLYFNPYSGDMEEVFLSKGSTGGCNQYMVATSRLISLALRAGIPLSNVVEQLKSSGTCPSYAVAKYKKEASKGNSCASAIAYAMESTQKEMYEELFDSEMDENVDLKKQKITVKQEKPQIKPTKAIPKYAKCPSCGEYTLINHGGCADCISCGYTKCE